MVAGSRGSWQEDSPPESYQEAQYSGKIVLRMPRNLHRILAEQAEHEDVSLNQYMVSLLSFNSGRLVR